MIHTFVAFQVESGHAADFERAHHDLVQFLGTQPGCLEIRVHRSLSDPLAYMVYGTWQSKDAWDRAHQTTGFGKVFRDLPVVDHGLSKAIFYEARYSTRGLAAAEQPGK